MFVFGVYVCRVRCMSYVYVSGVSACRYVLCYTSVGCSVRQYQAPLPLKPRPKRLSVERLSREVSPAVSVASSPAPASLSTARSPTRQTRDYAR